MFNGLSAQQHGGSVVAVGALLDRLDALESSPDRKATKKEDQAALDTLAARGIDKAERQRLRDLVDVVTAQPDATPPAPPADTERQAALEKLSAWYADWSETARAVITQRTRLERLGLLHPRRSQSSAQDAPVDAAPVDAAPVDAAPVDAAPAEAPPAAPVATAPAAPAAATPQNGQSQEVSPA